jgi:MFS transporter, MHS family, citrate/tricarballylate:H+ symporter
MLTPEQRREKIWDVVRVASGNFLEMYDFFIYGYFAVYIARTFFPTGNGFSRGCFRSAPSLQGS